MARDFLDCPQRNASSGHGRQASPSHRMGGCFVDADVLEGLCEDVVGANATNVLAWVISRREEPRRDLWHLV